MSPYWLHSNASVKRGRRGERRRGCRARGNGVGFTSACRKVKGLAHDPMPRYLLVLSFAHNAFICLTHLMPTIVGALPAQDDGAPPSFRRICKLVTDDRTCIDRSCAVSDQLT